MKKPWWMRVNIDFLLGVQNWRFGFSLGLKDYAREWSLAVYCGKRRWAFFQRELVTFR